MKKLFLVGILAAMMAMPVAAEDWQYSPELTIHMDKAKVSVVEGMQVLEFTATKVSADTRIEYTYIYNLDKRTIQIKEMKKFTSKIKYTSSFSPVPIDTPNPVIRARAEMAHEVYNRVLDKKA